MRDIKFRALTKYADVPHFVYGLLVKETDGFAIQIESECGGLHLAGVIPETVGRFTGLRDSAEHACWSGDLRMYHKKLYKVTDDGWRFLFERNLVEFGENGSVVVDEDVVYESTLVGTIPENPELIKNDN